jgi:hypothetical protein
LTKDSGPPSLSANRKKIRKLLSHGGGIPGSMRGTVWSWLLETTIVKGDGMFEVLQDQVGGGSRREEIEGDVARAFPDHVLFREEGSAGRADLLTVVTRYGVLNAQSRYSMGMSPLSFSLPFIFRKLLLTLCVHSCDPHCGHTPDSLPCGKGILVPRCRRQSKP